MSEALASIEVLMAILCAVSANEASVYGSFEFTHCKEQWLKRVVGIPFPNGVPSYDTIRWY